MGHERDDWSGIFVSLPGVDKAAHMWGGVNDPEGATPGYDPMTHMEYATATADAQVGRIMDALEDSGELDNTLVVLTADHGSVAAAAGTSTAIRAGERLRLLQLVLRRRRERRRLQLSPQEALQPLVDTGNVGLSYSDSSLNVWLKDQSPAKVAEAAGDHGGPARRHRGVAPRRRPLRPGDPGALGPDDDRRRAAVVRRARPRSSSTPRPPTTVPT